MGNLDFILIGIREDRTPDWAAAEAAIARLQPDSEDADWEALVEEYLDAHDAQEEQVRRAQYLLYQDLAEFRMAVEGIERHGEHRVLSSRGFRDSRLYLCGSEDGRELPGLYHSMLRLLRAGVTDAAGFEH